ncbi:MAG: porin family protein [Bacteroides sp.]|uniref:porin family protein n=1 Tax=Bacteroides sp. TaxID=29523 RepID=UPI00283B1107|nr:porin family protein [Bacteroides sp.]MDR3816840.1 porin family protein [Bacteroides sp.]
MKKCILFILFALVSVVGFSQITGWNAKVGMNISNYTGDADMNAKIGFKLGGGFEYAFDNTWSLQPSLFVSSKGAKQDELTINAYYLELPVMAAARFDVANNTNVVINAGPYLACGIAGKSKVDMGNVEYKENTFGDGGLKRFDAGLGVGVALELGQIIVGLDGQFGLVDVQKVGNPKNMNFSIVLGYKF